MFGFKQKTQEEKCAEGKHDWLYVRNDSEKHPHPKLAAAGITLFFNYYVCSNVKCEAEKKEKHFYGI